MSHTNLTWLDRLSDDLESLSANLKDPQWSNPLAIASFLRPVERLAWSVNSLGWRLLKVSSRLHDGCPAGYKEFWEGGRAEGRREVVSILVGPDTMMSDVGRLVTDLGMSAVDLVAQLEQSEATR